MLKNFLSLALISLLLSSCADEKPRILVFSKTKGYRHESITAGKLAFLKLGKENGFDVDTTEVADVFTEARLKNYNAVIFLCTTGDVLNQQQQNEFMRFIQAGGGFMGIHAAADTEYEWWWYGKLVGAYFKSHPKQQVAVVKKVNNFSPAKEDKLPAEWKRWDEWYNYRNISPDIKVLYNLDESTYEGGENGSNHPITWYHDFDGGRSFYTGLGHTPESYTDETFLSQVLMGVQYAIGKSLPDYSLAYTKKAPEENRFSKVVLGYYFYEPTEMTILPDGRIIFLERRGNVKLYDPAKDTITVINTFNVSILFEDGMIGLAQDPNFAENNWLYIFYSHPTRSANILSRFDFKDGKIDMTSEKELLEVAVQRISCCHTGGSLAFGPDGNLYISTGDNTNPWESDGFSPSDERKDRFPYDAQKSASNTNDLRGKILRIHPEANGTYTIPKGNLFPAGEDKTRGEIYTMGNRNPYRISIDKKTGWLYWGEVGPDAGNDDDARGSRGYDEVNQAKGPGFFGWPYFVGNNYAYGEYDFEKKITGAKHDPKKPINNSPNNTGKIELPPVSPSFIYYPYAASPDFPLMKTGGRNAMAGPVYYSEDFDGVENAFPDYFDGKVIIYDWVRNWIRLLTLDKEGKIVDIEPFMDGTKFNNIMDMSFGPDGKLYMLEYGTKWYGENEDARLVRIDFNRGNRAPIAGLAADKTSGEIPLTVNFTSSQTSDPDGDKITYELEIGNKVQVSPSGDFKFTFEKAGVYRPKLIVTDENGLKSTVGLTIVAGNVPPVVSISVEGNQSFYLPNTIFKYKIEVNDNEDGSTADGKISGERIKVSVDFLAEGYDSAQVAAGHQRPTHPGKILIAESDCKSCHLLNAKSAGPAYTDIARKYKVDTKAVETLSDKVINGGSGAWGDAAMAAHPQISKADASTMVSYILSLADEDESKRLPHIGTYKPAPAAKEGVNPQSAYILSAQYDDNAIGDAISLPGSASLALKAPVLTAGAAKLLTGGVTRQGSATGGNQRLDNIFHNSSATFQNVDMTKVKTMEFTIAEVVETSKGGQIEVYLDSLAGKKLGQVNFASSPKVQVRQGVNRLSAKISFKELTGKHNIVLVFVNPKAGKEDKLFTFGRIILGN